MQPIVAAALSAATGYLLGSLQPAYWLGRLIRGIDIRTVGYMNAGTRNVKATLGLWPAVCTAVIDTTKGVGALLISTYVLRLPESLAAVPAVTAVTGHIFPLYLGAFGRGFRGGKGSATAVGLFLFLTGTAIASGSFRAVSLAVLLTVAGIVYLASRSGDIAGMVTFLGMAVISPLELGTTSVGLVDTGLSLFLLISILLTSLRHGVFTLGRSIEVKIWRIVVRPLALLFIPIDFLFGRKILLLLLGAIALAFICADLLRFVTRLELSRLFKPSESGRFSSMTLFLVSVFLTFLVFPDTIPHLSLVFITIGDLGSKLFGIKYGKRRLYKSRTLEGLLGFVGTSLLASYILLLLIHVPLTFVLVGSLVAGLVELFSEDINDNFTVSLLTGGFLYALRFFLRI